MKQYRRILHPTDFSKASGPAFTEALRLAKQSRAELLLVHVLLRPTAYFGDGYVPPRTFETLEADARRSAQRRLSPLLAKARAARVRVKAFLLDGVPHEQIARAARLKRADLIVMGTHGRTGLSRFLMGSVTARAIPLAHCPVLTVREKSRRRS